MAATEEQLSQYPQLIRDLERALGPLNTLRALFNSTVVKCDHCGCFRSEDQGDRIHKEKAAGAIDKVNHLIDYMKQRLNESRKEAKG